MPRLIALLRPATVLIALLVVTAQATELKIATLYPPGSDAVQSLNAASEALAEHTAGAVRLQVYPGGVMGDDATVLRKIRIGQLDGALVSSSTLERLDVRAGDLSQPFQFDSLAEVDAAREHFDGRLTERLRQAGWLGFGPLDGGFSYLMSRQPIDGLEALRASKLWLPNTETVRELSQRLGVDYRVMGIADVLPALDTGAVDTLIAPPAAALTLNWHSRLDYLTDQPVVYTWGVLILPERALGDLDDAERSALKENMNAWAERLDDRMRASNREAGAAIRSLLQAVSIAPPALASVRSEVQAQTNSR